MSLASRTQNTVGAVFRYPTDLAFVTVGAILAYAIVTTLPPGSILRFIASLAFVTFLPGYALTAVLFPAAGRPRQQDDGGATPFARPGGIDAIERVALGLGLSLATVPIIVLVLPFTEWGLEMASVVGALVAVTVVVAQLGAVRRLRVPPADRFTVTIDGLSNRLSTAMGTGTTRVSSYVLLVAILAAAGMFLYAFSAPMAAGGYTQLSIYTAQDDDDLVAEMPSTAVPDQELPITFRIHNYEGEPMEYSLVIQEQVVDDGEVTERVTHHEVTAVSESTDGGRITAERSVTPTADDGETIRIAVMLFEGDAPATATMDQAMEYTYFWVTMETPPDAPGTVAGNETDGEPGEAGGEDDGEGGTDEGDDDALEDDADETDDDTDDADDGDDDDADDGDDDDADDGDDDDADDGDDDDDTDDADDGDDDDDDDGFFFNW